MHMQLSQRPLHAIHVDTIRKASYTPAQHLFNSNALLSNREKTETSRLILKKMQKHDAKKRKVSLCFIKIHTT